jgi:hypothetical protein
MYAMANIEYAGIKYRLIEPGYFEYDTNAWVSTGDVTVTNIETGVELFEDMMDEDTFEHLYDLGEWVMCDDEEQYGDN